MLPVLNLVCYVTLCEGLRAGAGSLSILYTSIVAVCSIVMNTIIITIIIIIIITDWLQYSRFLYRVRFLKVKS